VLPCAAVFVNGQVDDVVVPLDGALRPAACGVAAALRAAGRSVDLVLEAKKLKWALKVRGGSWTARGELRGPGRAGRSRRASSGARSRQHVAGEIRCVGWPYVCLLGLTGACFSACGVACPPQHAERLGAKRLVLVGASEWERGNVMVKDLAQREQTEVSVASLTA
jgi:hypothetical protein